jgi:hypothetical protein
VITDQLLQSLFLRRYALAFDCGGHHEQFLVAKGCSVAERGFTDDGVSDADALNVTAPQRSVL